MKSVLLRACAILAVGLSGCAIAPSYAPTSGPLPPNTGVVVLAAHHNGAGIDAILYDWEALEVRGRRNGLVTRLKPVRGGGLDETVIFLGILPADEYTPVRVTRGTNDYWIMNLDKWKSTFHVEPGRLTNLGTLTYQTFKGEDGGTRFVTGWERNDDEVADYLGAGYPDLWRAVSGLPVQGWNRPDDLEKLRTVSAIIRDYALGYVNRIETADGRIFAVGRLGAVRERTAAGKWVNHDTGSTRQLHSVAALDDGTLLVGGEASLLLRSRDAGKTWQRVLAPPVASPLFELGRFADGSIYTVVSNDTTVMFYRAKPTLDAWTQFGSIPLTGNKLLRLHPGHLVSVFPIKGKLVVMSGDTRVSVYDPVANTWTESATPLKQLRPAADDDGNLFVIGNKTPPAKNSVDVLMISRDLGKTWTELTEFNHTTEDIRIAGGKALYKEQIVIISESPYKKETRLQVSRDLGKTWTDVGPYEIGTPTLMQPRKSDVLLGFFSDVVVVSRDGGKTWERDSVRDKPKPAIQEPGS